MQDHGLAEVEALERLLLDPQVRSSRKSLDDLIADDFCETGGSGRTWIKGEILESLPQEQVLTIDMDSVQSRRIGNDVILITYRSKRIGAADVAAALRSSIWQQRGRKWKLVFHQGTPVPR